MATDRRISVHFSLHEFPGWRSASELEAARAEQLTRTILQPARRVWGPIVITSWLRSSGAHRDGSAVDFVPVLAHQEARDTGVQLVHGWLATHHPTAFGELLYEIPSPGEQTPHIHATLPGVGGAGEVLTQTGWTQDGRPTWELGYLVPSLLPLLVGAGLLLIFVVLAAGGGGGG